MQSKNKVGQTYFCGGIQRYSK